MVVAQAGRIGRQNSKAIYVNNITDLNNPPKCPILDTKINPIGLPSGLESNACFVIQQNLGTGNYTAQLAFSFRHDKIAIRRKSNTDSWTECGFNLLKILLKSCFFEKRLPIFKQRGIM